MRLRVTSVLLAVSLIIWGQQVDWVSGVRSKPFLDVREYNFPALSPGGSLVIGSNTITLPSAPLGLAVNSQIYISGGTGTAESVSITAWNSTTRSITFTCAHTHSGAWTIRSSTAGWQQAATVAGAGGTVFFPAGTYNLYGPFTAPYSRQTYMAADANSAIITSPNGANVQSFAVVGSKSDITFLNLGFDGNFANQTYQALTYANAIDGSGSTRLTVQNCKFHAFGYNVNTDAPYAAAIAAYGASEIAILNNIFLSIWGSEVILNPVYGARVDGNTFGSPLLADAQTPTNAWDTYSGGFGIFVASSDKVSITNNTMYGCQRSASLNSYGNLVGVDGSGGPATSFVQIQGNRFYGLGNGRGTVSVTHGSGTITGSGTAFQTSLDVGRTFKLENDSTEYQITAVASATSLTVTPTVVRATGSSLRYQYQNSGDAIAAYNVQGLSIIGNVVYDSGDNAFDVAASSSDSTGQVIFADNQAIRSQVDGLFTGGAMFNAQISNNIFLNNGRRQLSDHQAGIEMSPTNQGETTAKPMWHNTIQGNTCIDDQASATQLHCIQTESAAASSIFANTLIGNTFYTYNGGTPTGSFFDSGTTPTRQGTMFSQVSTSSAAMFTPVAFANLGSLVGFGNGTIAFCFDCTVASTCAGSGNGAFAKRLNDAWVCN